MIPDGVIEKIFHTLYRFSPNYLLYLINIYQHKRGIFEIKNNGLFFMHVPKSAGTSLYRALGIHDPGHITFRDACFLNKYICQKKLAIVVRSPHDRLFSTYNYAQQNVNKKPFTMVQKFGCFDTYLKYLKWVETSKAPKKHYFFFPITKYINAAKYENIYFISFDNLDKGVFELSKIFNLIYKDLPQLNKSQKSSTCRSLDEQALEKKIIERFYEKDNDIYNKIKCHPLVIASNLINSKIT